MSLRAAVGILSALTLAASIAVNPVVGASPLAQTDVIDLEQDCEERVPATISLPSESRSNVVDLNVMFVLDQISERFARTTVELVAESYEPLGIRVVPRFRKVKFRPDPGGKLRGVPAADVNRIIRESKELFGGKRPDGTDVVHTITNKNIYVEEGDALGLGGMADCIGGVRYPDRAFSVSEGWLGGERDQFGHRSVDKVIAHEIGHLMGARHEHSNCAEGPERHKCTLMFNASIWFLKSHVFGALESAIVRGHAVEYARP